MSILLLSTDWLLLARASLWRWGRTTTGRKKKVYWTNAHEGKKERQNVKMSHCCLLRTLVSETWLCVRPNSPKRPYNFHVQRVLILVLRVLEERRQLHFYTLQQLHIKTESHSLNVLRFIKLLIKIAFGLWMCTVGCLKVPYLFLCDSFHDGTKGRDSGYPHWAKTSRRARQRFYHS